MGDCRLRVGQIWMHLKRQSLYEVIHVDCAAQVSVLGDKQPAWAAILEHEPWVAYRPWGGHKIYLRVEREFLDGRFELYS